VTIIRRLPEAVVNRIAAGEVVERPAAVVKELVENSIDAEASIIDVVVRDGGRSLVAVADDGCGMSPEELKLAIERHATSKLSEDDLTCIGTLGFRGEALPSIAAVARLRIVSRISGTDSGWAITVDAGCKGRLQPAADPPGTHVEVRDLFFSTPARLQFLKAPATEFAHAMETVQRLAMAHPHIAFSLSNGARTPLRLPAAHGDKSAARLERVAQVMGREFADNAVAIDAAREAMRVFGYAGLPTLSRAAPTSQFLFVNGRPVRDRLLYGAVRAAYQEVLAGGRSPLVALFLELPLPAVDVNVHPTKAEVRFRDPGRVRGLLVSALRDALVCSGHRTATTLATTALAAMRTEPSDAAANANSAQASSRRQQLRGFGEAQSAFQAPLPALAASPRNPPHAEESEPEEPGESDGPLGEARAQLFGTYVIAQSHDGIVIVDQHAAHERLTQERIKRALAAGGVPRQGLLIPEVVELGEAEAERIRSRTAELQQLGLLVEPFGPGAVVVREVPALLGEVDCQGLIRDLADHLATDGEILALSERLTAVCATMACHGSIRAGQSLDVREMNALLRDMESTPMSGQCSHGRPTYVILKLTDIERLFGRR
jgi:DNA mismatch repair protein MutL